MSECIERIRRPHQMIAYEDLISTLRHTERTTECCKEEEKRCGSQTLRHHFTHEQLEKHLTTNHTQNQTRTNKIVIGLENETATWQSVQTKAQVSKAIGSIECGLSKLS